MIMFSIFNKKSSVNKEVIHDQVADIVNTSNKGLRSQPAIGKEKVGEH